MRSTARILAGFLVISSWCIGATLDERSAEPGEWGYRPEEGTTAATNPPSFSWRPQSGLTWEIDCRPAAESDWRYTASGLQFNVHCPPRTFPAGTYRWRYRGIDADGKPTSWSRTRTFTVPADAVAMPMPPRE